MVKKVNVTHHTDRRGSQCRVAGLRTECDEIADWFWSVDAGKYPNNKTSRRHQCGQKTTAANFIVQNDGFTKNS